MALKKQHKEIIALMIAITIMGLLFYSSSQPYQNQSITKDIDGVLGTRPFEAWLSQIVFFYGGEEVSIASNGYAAFIEFFIRKAVHFSTFFILAYAWLYGLNSHIKQTGIRVMVVILICVGYAALDEFHQSLTPNRTALLEDVILDSMGAITGTFTYLMMNLLVRPTRRKRW